MDIYFCDLCGVRVSDVDLKSGHGIRNRLDVICGTCLEMGHGKEWLSQRAKPKALAAVGAATLDAARDRLRTLEEDAPPKPVAAMRLDDESARIPLTPEPTPSDAHVVLADDLVSTIKVPPPVGHEAATNLASAANVFAAMGAPAMVSRGGAAGESSDDLADQDVDPIGTGTPAEVVSPFSFADGDAQKAETAAVGKASASNRDRPGSDRLGRKSGSGRTPRPTGKPATAKSGALKGKSPRRKGDDPAFAMIMKFSAVSVVLIILGFGFIYGKKTGMFGPKAERKSIQVDKQLEEMIKATTPIVTDAIRSDDVTKLEAAKARIDSCANAVDDFEKAALKNGWTEIQINQMLERTLKWNDLYMQKRQINDRIQILKHR